MRRRERIVFLLSGGGSTLKNLLERIEAAEVPGRVVAAIADRPAAGLEHASARGIPVRVVDRKAHRGPRELAAAFEAAVDPFAPDLIVMGGFLSLFPLPRSWRGRTLNVHPALLPRFGGKGFYGHRVHEAVLASGERTSGCTVHFVTDEVDGGPIVEQATVPVLPGDTPESLAARVQAAERRLLPECVRSFLEGRLDAVAERIRG